MLINQTIDKQAEFEQMHMNEELAIAIKNLSIKNRMSILLLLNPIEEEMAHEDLINEEIVRMVVDTTSHERKKEVNKTMELELVEKD